MRHTTSAAIAVAPAFIIGVFAAPASATNLGATTSPPDAVVDLPPTPLDPLLDPRLEGLPSITQHPDQP